MGEVAVVTGASAGIGRSCADRLFHSGWTVYGASRRGTASAGWHPLVMDVDDDRSVNEGIAAVLADSGHIDAVVAGAGWGLAGSVEETSIDEARRQLETNFWGAVRVVQRALPAMRAGGRGRIVLVSSIGGLLGLPFQAFYSASKFAMEGFGEALAYEVAPFGVTVSLVEPGNVRTDFTDSRRLAPVTASSPYAAAIARAIGTMAADERHGVAPERVAALVERLCSNDRPARRATVGRLDERIGPVAKRFLPNRIFERAAKGSLGL
ncbi:MAG: SDR family oxidoreductase [Acidimicrobiales bacterium]